MRLKSKAIFLGKNFVNMQWRQKYLVYQSIIFVPCYPQERTLFYIGKKKKCWIGLRCKRDIKQRKGLREGAVDQKGHMLTLKNSLEACMAVLQTGDLKKPQRVV